MEHEAQAPQRIERLQNLRRLPDAAQAQTADGQEPQRHHGPKQAPDHFCPAALQQKQSDEDDQRRGENNRPGPGAAILMPSTAESTEIAG